MRNSSTSFFPFENSGIPGEDDLFPFYFGLLSEDIWAGSISTIELANEFVLGVILGTAPELLWQNCHGLVIKAWKNRDCSVMIISSELC